MKGKALVVALAFLLAGGLTFAARTGATSTTKSNAATTQATTQSATHHETGKVSSMTSSDLVLRHEHLGKAKKISFVLNSATKQEGKIEQGDRVTVYYRDENGKKVATEVKTVPSKSQTRKS